MKGRSSFTAAEASEIRALLARKVRESKDAKKATLAKLGRRRFYIRDFMYGGREFTLKDFDDLVRSGRITTK